MSDSNEADRRRPTEDAEERRARRIEAVKRWVAYIEAEPPEVWGPQQRAVVEGQLDAARHSELSAAHRRRVRTVADEIIAARDETGTDD